MANGRPKVYDQFSFPPDEGIACTELGARQSEKDACDINRILLQYERTGQVPVIQEEALYADVSEFGSYQENLHKVMEAEALFMKLPPEVRNRFQNDPGSFLAFASDPANLDELVALKLVEPKKAPVAPAAPVAPVGAQPAAP